MKLSYDAPADFFKLNPRLHRGLFIFCHFVAIIHWNFPKKLKLKKEVYKG
jgi:hypothetical protein